jgi:hypothetical protein
MASTRCWAAVAAAACAALCCCFQDFDEDEVAAYKVEILAAVASLDRGLAANVSLL